MSDRSASEAEGCGFDPRPGYFSATESRAISKRVARFFRFYASRRTAKLSAAHRHCAIPRDVYRPHQPRRGGSTLAGADPSRPM